MNDQVEFSVSFLKSDQLYVLGIPKFIQFNKLIITIIINSLLLTVKQSLYGL